MRITPAVSIATSVPAPIAIPTDAAARAGASFTPSPTTAGVPSPAGPRPSPAKDPLSPKGPRMAGGAQDRAPPPPRRRAGPPRGGARTAHPRPRQDGPHPPPPLLPQE